MQGPLTLTLFMCMHIHYFNNKFNSFSFPQRRRQQQHRAADLIMFVNAAHRSTAAQQLPSPTA
jgi:hypothetical protein